MTFQQEIQHAPKAKAQPASGVTVSSGPGGFSFAIVGLTDLADFSSTAASMLGVTWMPARPIALNTERFIHPISKSEATAVSLAVEIVDPLSGPLVTSIAVSSGAHLPPIAFGDTYAFPVHQTFDLSTGSVFRRLVPGHCIIALRRADDVTVEPPYRPPEP